MSEATHALIAAQDGDPTAFERFVRLTIDDVTPYCRYLGDRDHLDDLVQDTYLRALRSLHTYRGDSDALRWLLTIARRACADAIEHHQRSRRTELTRRPTHDGSTPDPTESTTPASSCPGTCGNVVMSPSWPVHPCQSLRHSPLTTTRTTAAPAGAEGSGSSATSRGAPNAAYVRARTRPACHQAFGCRTRPVPLPPPTPQGHVESRQPAPGTAGSACVLPPLDMHCRSRLRTRLDKGWTPTLAQ